MTVSIFAPSLRAVSLAALFAVTAPLAALAAGGGGGDDDSDRDAPPTRTNTTLACPEGYVLDTETNLCRLIESGQLDDDTLYEAVREFAYAGEYGLATRALDAMSDQAADRVLTYRGFLLRMTGDIDGAMEVYLAAIDANPDNLLVRSYMGQGLVTLGRVAEAQAQLVEIRMRGGAGTWPEESLAEALRTGQTYSY